MQTYSVLLNTYRHERQALSTRRAQQQTSLAVFELWRALTLAAQSRRATGARRGAAPAPCATGSFCRVEDRRRGGASEVCHFVAYRSDLIIAVT